MSSSSRQDGKQILSIIGGVLIAVVIIIPVSLLAVLLGISDGHGEHSREPVSITIIIIGLIAGVFMAGYMTALLSRLKKMWPVIITGILLVILYILNSDTKLTAFDAAEIVITVLIIPLTCLGGWMGIKRI